MTTSIITLEQHGSQLSTIYVRPGCSSRRYHGSTHESHEQHAQEKLRRSPAVKYPTILTFTDDVSLKSEELWEGTCPICRPIVRDLSVFCRPQEATFQEQNAFIC